MKRKKVLLLFISITSIFLVEGCKKRETIEEKNIKEREYQISQHREVKINNKPLESQEVETNNKLLENQEIKINNNLLENQKIERDNKLLEDQTIKTDEELLENSTTEVNDELKINIYEKGYDLPISDKDKKEAEVECKIVMNKVRNIYKNADKGDFLNVIISSKTAEQMLDVLKETGYAVFSSDFYLNMCNYEKIDNFFKDALDGKKGEAILYEIHSSGSIGRRKFIFDGKDMYELYTNTTWNEENTPVITFISYNRIKQWQYTKKGWFLFVYCVPEVPEVTEVVYGNAMIRVKPIKEEYVEIAMKYLIPIGYQGNNLFCSNWSAGQMEDIDYNAIFQYLYSLKYQKEFDSEQYSDGIPKKEFERLIMEYLPVTVEQMEQYAVFDLKSQTYKWEMLGCGNYSPNAFSTAQPEITDIKENKDGTTTLTVDVVCMMAESDAAIRHQLMVQFLENGGIRYLENKIIDYELEPMPAYQYRVGK